MSKSISFSSPDPISQAVTLMDWDIYPNCICIAGDTWTLDKFKIDFKAVVLLKPSYPTQKYEMLVRRLEQDHVIDFITWAASAKGEGNIVADEWEKRLRGSMTYQGEKKCEIDNRDKLEARLKGSATKAINASVDNYDKKHKGPDGKMQILHKIEENDPRLNQ